LALRKINRALLALLAGDRPRAKSLVVTMFGDAIQPHGGAVWLGELIDLLGPFEIGERVVRSSVFRLVKDGWLEAERSGRRSLYTLTVSGARRFERAHRRIYLRPTAHWSGDWTLLLTDKFRGAERTRLDRELQWEGFRSLNPATWLRPAGDSEAAGEILERLGVSARVIVCSARDVESVSGRPLRSTIPSLWDLKPINAGYRRFIARFSPIAALANGPDEWTPGEAFGGRTLLIHAFRRVLLHDPLFPTELLPANWLGESAYTLCRSIYQRIHSAAERRILSALSQNPEPRANGEATEIFRQRFGGL
jgi:phenylacetic acid degradation operon negative regulatory protein